MADKNIPGRVEALQIAPGRYEGWQLQRANREKCVARFPEDQLSGGNWVEDRSAPSTVEIMGGEIAVAGVANLIEAYPVEHTPASEPGRLRRFGSKTLALFKNLRSVDPSLN